MLLRFNVEPSNTQLLHRTAALSPIRKEISYFLSGLVEAYGGSNLPPLFGRMKAIYYLFTSSYAFSVTSVSIPDLLIWSHSSKIGFIDCLLSESFVYRTLLTNPEIVHENQTENEGFRSGFHVLKGVVHFSKG